MLVFQMEVRVFAVLPASTGHLHLPPHVLHVLQGNSKDQQKKLKPQLNLPQKQPQNKLMYTPATERQFNFISH